MPPIGFFFIISTKYVVKNFLKNTVNKFLKFLFVKNTTANENIEYLLRTFSVPWFKEQA